MKSDLMGMLLLLSVGMAQAAQSPRPVPTLQTTEVAAPRRAHPHTSPARKAEITRRMFWLALSMR